MKQPAISLFWKFSFWIFALTTLWLSLIPAGQVPSQLHFWDKAQHALGFAALVLLGLQAYPCRIKLLLIALVFFGAGIELAQWMTGWRQGDWQDWLADCLGLMIGYTAWQMAFMLTKARR